MGRKEEGQMKYEKEVVLKDGRRCLIRSGTGEDAAQAMECFIRTHEETDFLASYPDESTLDVAGEESFLRQKEQSPCEVELLAILEGRAVGMAGLDQVGRGEKLRHRAGFGISIEKRSWGLGIGRALSEACLDCARKAGYVQVELEVVGENEAAISLYRSLGFREYGRNPRGFRSRVAGW